MASLCSAAVTALADRVTVRPEDSAGLVVVSGDVEDYTDEFLTLRIAGAGLKIYPSATVAALETYRTPLQMSGLERYRRGDLAGAIADFEQALEREQRKWMRREILASLVQCQQRRGNREAAAARFIEIVAEDPHTRFWQVAPLTWVAESASERLQAAGRQWVISNSEAVRLVGASVLLGATASRLTGLAELHKLARSSDRYVGALAQAQVWNASLQTANPSAEEIARWEREIERMPPSVRGGPWYVIGQARLRRSEPDEAAAAMLRVLLVHDGDELLASRAGVEAGLALTRMSRHDEAERVLQEVVDRFAGTPAAAEAAQALKERVQAQNVQQAPAANSSR